MFRKEQFAKRSNNDEDAPTLDYLRNVTQNIDERLRFLRYTKKKPAGWRFSAIQIDEMWIEKEEGENTLRDEKRSGE